MKLTLLRKEFTQKSTIGSLLIDDQFFCFTLEDVVREGDKVNGQTAIPFGIYKVIIDFSNRFKKDMPHILDVPNFEGIRIHSGNTDADTEGCILLGFTKQRDFIGNSRLAFDAFFPKLQQGVKNGEVTIEIKEA
jgi:hypothetical protein